MPKSVTGVVDRWIGQRLRDLRKQRGMSQGALGKAIGVAYQQVGKYEKGTNRIGAVRLRTIAGALRIKEADIYEGLPPDIERVASFGDVRQAGYQSAPFDSDTRRRLLEAFDRISDAKARELVLYMIERLGDSEPPASEPPLVSENEKPAGRRRKR